MKGEGREEAKEGGDERREDDEKTEPFFPRFNDKKTSSSLRGGEKRKRPEEKWGSEGWRFKWMKGEKLDVVFSLYQLVQSIIYFLVFIQWTLSRKYYINTECIVLLLLLLL